MNFNRKNPERQSVRLTLEALEDRLVLSQTAVPLDVFVFHGTQLSASSVLFGDGGHGLDDNIKAMASMAYKAVHALNGKDRVIDVDWGSIGSPAKGGHGAAQDLHQILQQEHGPHDVEVIGFSRGGYAAEAFIKESLREPGVRRLQAVFLDPTGINALGDGKLQPQENGPWGREHNISYHDGLHFLPGGLGVTDEYSLAGENRPGGDGGNALKSHAGFPNWYTAGGGQSRLVQDLLTFEQATPAQAAAAKSAAAASGLATGVQELYVPGGGPGLLLPLLVSVGEHAIEVLVDDAGRALEVAAGKAGQFIVATFDKPGHAVSALLNSAGTVVKTATGAADSLEHAVEHFAESVWNDVPNWIKHPFGLF